MPRTHATIAGLLITVDGADGLVSQGSVPGNPGTLATAASTYAVGCELTDASTGKRYVNQGTVAAPVWVQVSENLITVAAKSVTATLTAAEVIGGLITANQAAAGAATYTLPTGALLQAALPGGFAVGASILFRICNISTVAAEDVTLEGGVGTTLVGSGVVASNAAATDRSAATFLIVKTANEAFTAYRVS